MQRRSFPSVSFDGQTMPGVVAMVASVAVVYVASASFLALSAAAVGVPVGQSDLRHIRLIAYLVATNLLAIRLFCPSGFLVLLVL